MSSWTGHREWRATQQTTRIDAGRHAFDMAYQEVGDGDPATLFLHGIPTWSYLFHEIADAIGYAIVPDLPGYGYTQYAAAPGESADATASVDRFDAPAYDRSIRAQTEYVRAFLDACDLDSVQVVGHDIGGAVALRLAVETDRVERLVLTNACCYDNFPNEDVPPLGGIRRARTLTYQETISDVRKKLTGSWDVCRDDRPVDAFINAMVAPYADRTRYPTDLARNAIALNTNHTLELVPHFDKVTAETLLLWGHPGDEQHVGYAEQLADDLPNATLETLSPSHHWAMFERPEAYRDGLAGFLD